MARKKCEICGKIFMQSRFSEIELCEECDETYHLSRSRFGLDAVEDSID